uniref:Uncharacterized protein n=1 Tax=Avena sativa TaxID=4498 RepID=A0ACD5VQC3_AVESA
MHTPFMDKASHHRTGVGAAGRLKQRLALLLVRSSCTTNTTKTTTTSPPTFVRLDKATANNPRQEPRHSPDWCTYQRPKLEEGSRSRRRSALVVHTSTDGAGTASGHRPFRSEAPLLSSSLPTNNAKRQSKSRGKPGSQSVPRRQRSCSSRGRGRRPRTTSTATMYSYSSSTMTDDESGEEAETRTLFSSLSFSSDSTSEFYHTNSSTASKKSQKNAPHRAPRRPSVTAKHHEKKNRKKMGAEAEEVGSIGAGMAVVKRSSNPYADFRSSMVEMVVERRIASVGKMEELLGPYLSLNSPEHHPAILAAFEDVWEAVFGQA